MEPQVQSKTLKVVLVGDSAVGKTSIVHRFVHGNFVPDTNASVAAASFQHSFVISGQTININVWDTAVQERFRSLTRMYYTKAAAIVLVYDVTSKQSFLGLRNWLEEVHEVCQHQHVLAVVGNKADLPEAVSDEDSSNFASAQGALHFRTSAVDGQGILEVFQTIAQVALELSPPTTKVEHTRKLSEQATKKKRCC